MRARPIGSVVASIRATSQRMHARIEDNIAEHGLVYPWWIPVLSLLGLTVTTAAAVGLRQDLWPPWQLLGLLALVMVPDILQLIYGRSFPDMVENLGVLAAATWLITHPIDRPGAFDCAPALLALLVAEVVARDGVRQGLIWVGISLGLLVGVDTWGPGVRGLPVHLADIELGFVIGYMLLWQMRALIAERESREGERTRATLAERQRIAREIHDLVAHSLSVTLLQITGARHALRDVQHAGDVADVDEALADAERVGRQAMADIRQTVSTLAEGPSDRHALPTAADIGGLVDQMERAGLSIAYEEVGDPSRLADATGLGVYRIAQESLANIAKHAPAGAATIELTVTQNWARLQVRNPLNGSEPADRDRGSGLTGMQARATQLGAVLAAGPDGEDWLVDLKLQLRERNGKLFCPLGHRVTW